MGGALAPGSHARPSGSHSFPKSLSDRSLAPLLPYLPPPSAGSEERPTLMRRARAGPNEVRIFRERVSALINRGLGRRH